jgi:WD40 repeat protein
MCVRLPAGRPPLRERGSAADLRTPTHNRQSPVTRATPGVRQSVGGAALLLAAACGHSEPFTPGPPRASGPFQASQPLRLTYNIGADTHAAWSADGSRVYYSVQDSFTVDKDRCIARLEATGGVRTTLACPSNPANDTTQVLDQPAPLGGKLAWASSELGIFEHSQFRHAIWLGPDAPAAVATAVRVFPYLAPSGLIHNAPIYLQWLRPGVLLYLGAENGCCRKDTLRFGLEVVLLDVTLSPAAPTYVPGTTRASAVSASDDGTAIYYTFYGDSRVYRQELAGGAVTIAHDFGPGRIARDPSAVGNRLVAIVDGQPRYWDRPPFGFVQIDYGGLVSVVDLTTGAETLMPDRGNLYKRPRLSPDGSRLVVEGYPFSVNLVTDPTGAVVGADTLVSKWADLWLVEE